MRRINSNLKDYYIDLIKDFLTYDPCSNAEDRSILKQALDDVLAGKVIKSASYTSKKKGIQGSSQLKLYLDTLEKWMQNVDLDGLEMIKKDIRNRLKSNFKPNNENKSIEGYQMHWNAAKLLANGICSKNDFDGLSPDVQTLFVQCCDTVVFLFQNGLTVEWVKSLDFEQLRRWMNNQDTWHYFLDVLKIPMDTLIQEKNISLIDNVIFNSQHSPQKLSKATPLKTYGRKESTKKKYSVNDELLLNEYLENNIDDSIISFVQPRLIKVLAGKYPGLFEKTLSKTFNYNFTDKEVSFLCRTLTFIEGFEYVAEKLDKTSRESFIRAIMDSKVFLNKISSFEDFVALTKFVIVNTELSFARTEFIQKLPIQILMRDITPLFALSNSHDLNDFKQEIFDVLLEKLQQPLPDFNHDDVAWKNIDPVALYGKLFFYLNEEQRKSLTGILTNLGLYAGKKALDHYKFSPCITQVYYALLEDTQDKKNAAMAAVAFEDVNWLQESFPIEKCPFLVEAGNMNILANAFVQSPVILNKIAENNKTLASDAFQKNKGFDQAESYYAVVISNAENLVLEKLKQRDDFIQKLDQAINYCSKRENIFFNQALSSSDESFLKKASIYQNITKIIITHKNQYAISERDETAQQRCVENIANDARKLTVSSKINKEQGFFHRAIRALLRFFSRKAKPEEAGVPLIKAEDYLKHGVGFFPTQTLKDLKNVTEPENFRYLCKN